MFSWALDTTIVMCRQPRYPERQSPLAPFLETQNLYTSSSIDDPKLYLIRQMVTQDQLSHITRLSHTRSIGPRFCCITRAWSPKSNMLCICCATHKNVLDVSHRSFIGSRHTDRQTPIKTIGARQSLFWTANTFWILAIHKSMHT